MPRVFREGSLSFRYPDNWQLEREDNDHGWTVSVYSPSTAFLTLSLDTDYPDTERVAATVLEAMRSEYPELEADERAEQFAGVRRRQPAVALQERGAPLALLERQLLVRAEQLHQVTLAQRDEVLAVLVLGHGRILVG